MISTQTNHLHLDSSIWLIEIFCENSVYPRLPQRLWHRSRCTNGA